MRRLTIDERDLYRAATGRDAPWCVLQRWPGWWYRRFRGLTLGCLILVKDDDPALVCHEAVHVAQFYAAPSTFWLRYLWELARVGYAANRYEREAFAVAAAVKNAMRSERERPRQRQA